MHARLLRSVVVVATFTVCFVVYLVTPFDAVSSASTVPRDADVKVNSASLAATSDRFPLPIISRKFCDAQRSVVTNFRHAFRMYLHPAGKDVIISDLVVSNLATGNFFEAHIRRQIEQALVGMQNAVILDIGANIGLHALYFASMGHTIHAFEPLASNADILKCTIAANRFDNVVVNTFGLSTEATVACMDVPDDSNQGHAVITGIGKQSSGDRKPCKKPVEVRRLDEFLSANNVRPYLIKIDIEGHEMMALTPAKEYLRAHPPEHIFSEFATGQLVSAGTRPRDYLQFFWDLGYTVEWNGKLLRPDSHKDVAALLNSTMADIHAFFQS